jgi:hypothetical protein
MPPAAWAAHGKAGEEAIGEPYERRKRLGGEGSSKTRELPEVSAGKFRADDVRVRTEGGDRVRVEIEPCGHLREVIHHCRDWRCISNLSGPTRKHTMSRVAAAPGGTEISR